MTYWPTSGNKRHALGVTVTSEHAFIAAVCLDINSGYATNLANKSCLLWCLKSKSVIALCYVCDVLRELPEWCLTAVTKHENWCWYFTIYSGLSTVECIQKKFNSVKMHSCIQMAAGINKIFNQAFEFKITVVFHYRSD